MVLVGTKIDLRDKVESSLSNEEGLRLLEKHKFFSFVECSAKMMNNYKSAFDKAIMATLKHRTMGV